MQIAIPTSTDDRTPMTVTVSDVCPVCGAPRRITGNILDCDVVMTDCDHYLNGFYWSRLEAVNDPVWRAYIDMIVQPAPTFTTPADTVLQTIARAMEASPTLTAPDDSIPFAESFELMPDPLPYRLPSVPSAPPSNYASELDNERVNIVRIERQKAGTFHLAICETDDDEHKRVDVQVWTEHRNLIKKAGYVIDWSARIIEFSKPIPVILAWKEQHHNLRIQEVYIP